MNSKKKASIWWLVIAGIVAYSGYLYLVKPPTKIQNQPSFYQGKSADLVQIIATQKDSMNNKVVEVTGELTSIEQPFLVLNQSVFCKMENFQNTGVLKSGDRVKIKGRFIGFDELLNEVKLDQCVVLEK